MNVAEIFKTMAYGPAPESDTAAIDWIERHGKAFDLFIGGKFVKPKSGETFEVHNPATGAVLAHVAQAGSPDVEAAYEAAAKAGKNWAARRRPSARSWRVGCPTRG